jgi:hypothetical protein
MAQVYAALAYYHANQEQIDALIAEEERQATQLEEQHRRPRQDGE